MIPIKVISTQEQEILKVTFFPTDICNFNCSYCFPGSHDERYRYPKNVDLVIANFRKLFDVYTKQLNKKKFHVMIAGGGEPTMWPGLEKFCKEIKESHNVYITIVTNGSRTVRWWTENSAYFDDAVLSCHHEYVDIDHHIAVGDLLFEAGAKVTGLMLMDAKNWDKCVSYVDRMMTSKHPWYIQTKEIVDAPGQGVDIYTPEQFDYVNDSLKRIPNSEWIFKRLSEIRMHESVVLFDNDTAVAARPHTILTNDWNHFEGWKCNIGHEAVGIDASGKVFAGSCRLDIFDGKRVNILDEDFDTNITPRQIVCTLKNCFCQPDTHATKSLQL
jgi:organic radical activating enzyme